MDIDNIIDNIKVEFLIIRELLEGMSIEQWLMRHPLNKVLAGTNFESHLHKAVRLEILWNFEGMYIDPNVRVVAGFNFIVTTSKSICYLSG